MQLNRKCMRKCHATHATNTLINIKLFLVGHLGTNFYPIYVMWIDSEPASN